MKPSEKKDPLHEIKEILEEYEKGTPKRKSEDLSG